MAREADTKGYIKLHRKAQQTEVFKNAHAWQLFTYCLFNAKFSGDEAGTFITTKKEIAEALGIGRPALDKFMKILKENDCIDYKIKKGSNGGTEIKIINYKKYQGNQM